MNEPLSRRDALRLGVAGLACSVAEARAADPQPKADDPPSRKFLTPHKDFNDVSRGNPVPHSLTGEALLKAKLTPETWQLEIVAEDKATIEKPVTLNYATLVKLGEKHGLKFLKAMQCNNIALPLGQGLWEGVPLREVLKLCGKQTNARRLFYWGFHNDKPEQIFRSSLAMSQVLDTPPGDMPPFLAYRLNGEPLSLKRGGPVRMVIPWAHGFKSVKWLQKIVLTNKYENNDTYALQNNDPESYLKTAAYFENQKDQSFDAGQKITIRGTAMVGWPGLERVEYWLRPGVNSTLPDEDPAWAKAEWKPCVIDPPPTDWGTEFPKDVWGFDKDGKPKEWPMRFSIAHWTLVLKGVKAEKYELRVRTIDKNGYAQPEPRPGQKSGRNLIQCKLIEVK